MRGETLERRFNATDAICRRKKFLSIRLQSIFPFGILRQEFERSIQLHWSPRCSLRASCHREKERIYHCIELSRTIEKRPCDFSLRLSLGDIHPCLPDYALKLSTFLFFYVLVDLSLCFCDFKTTPGLGRMPGPSKSDVTRIHTD